MDKTNIIIGYDEFAAWEVEMAQGKARGLIGKHGFTYDDLPDLEQELLLVVYLKRGTTDKWSHIKASQKTVMSRILDNKIRDIIDSVNADKRRVHTATDSLSSEVGRSEKDDEPITLEDLLCEDYSIKKHWDPLSNISEDLRIELSLKFHHFSEIQQRIINLLEQGFSITETAKALGIKRTTLNREIERMRKLFYKNGLHEYL